MICKRIITIWVLLFMLLPLGSEAAVDIKHTADSLRSELGNAANARDSLDIMGNLYDLLPRDSGMPVGLQMIDVAEKAGNMSLALDMIRHVSNRSVRNDSLLVALLKRTNNYTDRNNEAEIEAGKIPVDYEDLMETRTFLRLSRNMHQAQFSRPEKRGELLKDLLRTNTTARPKNIYDRIVLLHSLCTLLMQMGSSDLLPAYLDSLGVLINTLPPRASMTLRNAYNTHAALIYAKTGQLDKAKQANLQILDNISAREKQYKEYGRKFRNFDSNRYVTYQRLLSIFPVLTPEEMEKYYHLALDIAGRDNTAASTYKNFQGPDLFYNLYHKNYAEALTLIKKGLATSYTIAIRKELLKYEIECAKALGDKETLLDASTKYIDLLEKQLDAKLEDKYSELQLVYSTYRMKNNFDSLQLEKQSSETSLIRTILVISVAAGLILLVLVIVLYRTNKKKIALLETLDQSNKALTEERKNLEASRSELVEARDMAQRANNLKTDFIKNMSYEVNAPLKAINEYSRLILDFADASNRKYLERFTNLVDLNCELLTTIIEDVLYISEIDSHSIPINNRATDLRTLSETVIDGVKHRVAPGVSIEFDETSPCYSLYTDPQRVHQILLNLLTNAAKFTRDGSIILGYKVDGDKVVFSVTDTGIGIKPEMKDTIFERFVKLDKETQGTGLGLTISRLLARLLGGDVQLDTTYNKGARFILILPKK